MAYHTVRDIRLLSLCMMDRVLVDLKAQGIECIQKANGITALEYLRDNDQNLTKYAKFLLRVIAHMTGEQQDLSNEEDSEEEIPELQ